jgi:uncharacterized protein (DUF58 family)
MLNKLFKKNNTITVKKSSDSSDFSNSTITSKQAARPLNENFGVSCSIEELISLKLQAETLKFPLKRRSKSHLTGAKQSTLRGRGIDFDEVRAYQAGDEIRSIDWRVTARTGTTHTKIYKEEKEKPVYVLLDLRHNMFFGSQRYFKSVSACHVASLLAWASLKNGDRFGALVFSENQHQEQKPKSGNKAALNFINIAHRFSEQLLQSSQEPQTEDNVNSETLSSALKKLQQVVRPGSLIYLISDFHDFDNEAKKSLSMLSRHNDLMAIHISDPLEQTLPQAKRLLFTNSEAKESAITEIQGQQKKVRSRYQEHFTSKNKHIENELLMVGVPSIYISSDSEAYTQLQNIRTQEKK